MIIGVPKEIKNHEYRVGLTTLAVKELVNAGHQVVVETNAGIGIGLTDEQYLAYLFGKDILVKGVIFSQIRSTSNDMIGVIKEYTLALRENGVKPMPKQKVDKNTPPPPPPEDAILLLDQVE